MLPFSGENIKEVPQKPGVYFFYNEKKELIYIGKAVNLKKRLNTYLKKHYLQGILFEDAIKFFEFQLAGDEREAFLLERDLIKNRKPKYNIKLRDDKNFLFVVLDEETEYPRLKLSRRIEKDGVYLGPFVPVFYAKTLLNFLQKAFKIRTCKEKIPFKRKRPCLDYFIGLCTAPCTGYVNKEEYRKQVEEFKRFVKGDREKYIEELKEKMKNYSRLLEFEKAAEIRDTIFVLEKLSKKTHRTETYKKTIDYWGIKKEKNSYLFMGLFYSEGEIIGQDTRLINSYQIDVDVCLEFFSIYYSEKKNPPEKLVIDLDKTLLKEIKSFIEKNFKTKLLLKKNSFDKEILSTIRENLDYKMREHFEENALSKLKEITGLNKIPQTIEGFDISHIQGEKTVGSCVRFKGEFPDKKLYRRYFLSEYTKPDDPSNMIKLLKKRFHKRKNYPDIILIDGGKQQLNSALKVKRELKIPSFFISIAKGDKEKIFLENGKIYEDEGDDMMKLLKKVRDEAHRYAIKYHRKKRIEGEFEK